MLGKVKILIVLETSIKKRNRIWIWILTIRKIRRYGYVWSEEGEMKIIRIEICGGIIAGLGIGERGGGKN